MPGFPALSSVVDFSRMHRSHERIGEFATRDMLLREEYLRNYGTNVSGKTHQTRYPPPSNISRVENPPSKQD
eukprot:scaffold369_cov177-Ochromonas_danica.AAC.32